LGIRIVGVLSTPGWRGLKGLFCRTPSNISWWFSSRKIMDEITDTGLLDVVPSAVPAEAPPGIN
jgi:hypothetical protein